MSTAADNTTDGKLAQAVSCPSKYSIPKAPHKPAVKCELTCMPFFVAARLEALAPSTETTRVFTECSCTRPSVCVCVCVSVCLCVCVFVCLCVCVCVCVGGWVDVFTVTVSSDCLQLECRRARSIHLDRSQNVLTGASIGPQGSDFARCPASFSDQQGGRYRRGALPLQTSVCTTLNPKFA